eukprot:TRINITY_DN481_c0_g3_i2.p1 TRINITY_DN481_c0_g3~~TRINITY_DN481_c0_g3_i2.p1  ORF type:complete len:319 (-),score=45.41 TRINITY_DN481_c0_g3_i2:3216-4172(-)
MRVLRLPSPAERLPTRGESRFCWDDCCRAGSNNTSTDPTSPIGVGNLAAAAVSAYLLQDSFNQAGLLPGQVDSFRSNYSDYTGYVPVNTAHELKDPTRWQALVETRFGLGLFVEQQHLTPQGGHVTPFSYSRASDFSVPPPVASQNASAPAYKAQADEVLAASRNLTDAQKMTVEHFDNKLLALGFDSVLYLGPRFGKDKLDDFIKITALTGLTLTDAFIAVWYQKTKYDSVRPTTAISYLYQNEFVTAWGGPGLGNTQVNGSEWQSYLRTQAHSDYTSGSACFCAAVAASSRAFYGSDALGTPQGVAYFSFLNVRPH